MIFESRPKYIDLSSQISDCEVGRRYVGGARGEGGGRDGWNEEGEERGGSKERRERREKEGGDGEGGWGSEEEAAGRRGRQERGERREGGGEGDEPGAGQEKAELEVERTRREWRSRV